MPMLRALPAMVRTAASISAADKSARLVGWQQDVGAQVSVGEVLCQLETTKTLFDVEATSTGYFYSVLESQSQVDAGQVIAMISDSPLSDYRTAFQQTVSTASTSDQASDKLQITKKAEILALRHNLDLAKLMQDLGKKVQVAD